MAAWGSGDPRWLVADLQDQGKNVNQWHWEEKSRLEWSKRKLVELLEGLQTEAQGGWARLTKLKSCTGEASLTVRKQNKKFAVYDLNLTLGWEGEWAAGDAEEEPAKVSGNLAISEFASLNDHEDIVYTVTVSGSGAGCAELRAAVEALQPEVFRRLDQFVAELLQS